MECGRKKKHSKYEEYIGDVKQTSGIYAITINDWVVYVGKSNKMRRRVRNHIRYATKGYDRAKYGLLSYAITATDDEGKKVYQVKCVELKKCSIEELGDMEKMCIEICSNLPLNTHLSQPPVPKGLKIVDFIRDLDQCKKYPEVLQLLVD